MIAGKEQIVFFETLAKKQEQIYSDSCDCGIRVEDNRNLFDEICKNISELKTIYKNTVKSWGNPAICWGKNITFFIPTEIDGSTYIGFNIKISFNSDKRKNVKFFAININSSNTNKNPFILEN